VDGTRDAFASLLWLRAPGANVMLSLAWLPVFATTQGHANGTCSVWSLVMGMREDAPFELNRVSATPVPIGDVISSGQKTPQHRGRGVVASPPEAGGRSSPTPGGASTGAGAGAVRYGLHICRFVSCRVIGLEHLFLVRVLLRGLQARWFYLQCLLLY
jgi:hypothetical protein